MVDGDQPADDEMPDAEQPPPSEPPIDQIPATLSHGGRYIQYNIFGNFFEVTSKYKPPIMPIGKGAYGIVCSTMNVEANEQVAIKKISNAFDNRVDAKRTLREIKLLRHMDHENEVSTNGIISPVKDAISTPDGKNQEKEAKSNYHKGAIPLSIFGNEEPESGDSSDLQDVFMHQSSFERKNNQTASKVVSINDLISNLYSQFVIFCSLMFLNLWLYDV